MLSRFVELAKTANEGGLNYFNAYYGYTCFVAITLYISYAYKVYRNMYSASFQIRIKKVHANIFP